ncbi:DUF4153 domain-containing protein [Rhodobacter maris]|uniref:Uncharacterized protein DUF4153 n=1 Tax=Rhodobacter maris TaxID=446682 RepID=A0A285S607_9RHOB|nr:DUF4153 domain-containing protein [Rhodobacter maris]SOC02810.1 uncharacterized protein DUF4153 [Rhodobacter maris]
MTERLIFIFIGLVGGLAFWGLTEAPEVFRAAFLWLPLCVAAAAFFFALLSMLSDLGLRRALLLAAGIALVTAALSALERSAFANAAQMLDTGHNLAALIVLGTLPVPFALAFGREGRHGLTDYRILFMESWNIVVRQLAAWLFVGVVFAVLWLMGALLDLVGVHLLSALLQQGLAVWLILGATLGLGLSVVTEMSDMVSPYLLLRFLRLLTPLVLAVVTVFLAALPLRGLGHLFGALSAASALLATALAVIGLVSVVVDQDEIEEAHAPVLTWSARGLMLLLPALAGLAIWALAERVRQYGWTPDRVAATALAGVVAGYALGYLGALLSGRRWMEKLRQANVAMAFAMIGLAALWLTPLISPERIAAQGQLARFAAGTVQAGALPLWEMAHDWGRPGAAALADLRKEASQDGALAGRLAQLDAAENRFSFARAAAPASVPVTWPAGLVLWPAGEALPEGLEAALLAALEPTEQAQCAAPAGAGAVPSCALVLADLSPVAPGPEAVLLRAAEWGAPSVFVKGPKGWKRVAARLLGAGTAPSGTDLITALEAGSVAPVPVDLRALQAGAWQIIVLPQ